MTPKPDNPQRENTMKVMKLTASAFALAIGLGWGAAQAQQVSDDVVKIGILNDQSGLYADLAGQGSVIAARMAVEDFGGKVLGKPVEVVFADHQNKPDVASSIANQWIDTEKVDVIMDVPTSSVALAIQEITKNKKRVHINSGAATSDLTGKACSPTGIHWTYDTYALANGTGRAVVQQGGGTWFFLTADYAFGHALERDTANVVKEMGGTIVGSVRHPFPNQGARPISSHPTIALPCRATMSCTRSMNCAYCAWLSASTSSPPRWRYGPGVMAASSRTTSSTNW
jgi:branched-chain amino acid transport system substrate-binding protein